MFWFPDFPAAIRSALVFFLVLSSLNPAAHAALYTKDDIPEFLQVTEWMGNAVTKKSLEGQTVLISMLNLTDPRAIQKIKVLKLWHLKYFADGLRIIIVVTPDQEFEKNPDYFRKILQPYKLLFPAVLDSQGFLRKAYNLQSTPSDYLIDSRGKIREKIAASVPFEQEENRIRAIMQEVETNLTDKKDIYPLPGLVEIQTLELGYKKLGSFGNIASQSTVVPDLPQTYTLPENMPEGRYYLSGKWKFLEDHLETAEPGCFIEIPWDGRPVYVVAGTNREGGSAVEALVDGQSLTEKKLRGRNLFKQSGKSYILVRNFALYAVNKPLPAGTHRLRLIFSTSGVEFFRIIFASDDINRQAAA